MAGITLRDKAMSAEREYQVTDSVITVSLRNLRALLNLAGNGDLRYYLNGLLIEATADETRIAATNGHLLGVFREVVENAIEGESVSLIIPREIVEMLAGLPKNTIIELRGSDVHWTLSYDQTTVRFLAIEAIFPNYRAVIPAGEPSGIAAQISPDLLSKFHKIGKSLGAGSEKWPAVHHNGKESAALVTIASVPDFVGVIMPIKLDASAARFTAANWSRETLTAATEA